MTTGTQDLNQNLNSEESDETNSDILSEGWSSDSEEPKEIQYLASENEFLEGPSLILTSYPFEEGKKKEENKKKFLMAKIKPKCQD